MAEKVTPPWEEYDKEYTAFQEREGIPVHEGLYVEDIRELELGEWNRTGGRGAFVNLMGMEGMCDIQLQEIPAGQELNPQRHLHGSLVFVAKGNGLTSIGSGDEQTTFEWGQGALFYVPRNTRYIHVNGGDEPVLLVSQTSLPLLYSILQDDETIWNNEGSDQWSNVRDEDFYSSISELKEGTDVQGRMYWDSNFIPDAVSFDKLVEWEGRGVGNSTIYLPFDKSSMHSHISEFRPGQYKKAHRHISGANVMLVSGEGYTLMWKEGDEDEKVRIPWGPYSLFTPPTMWFHQHFNTSPNDELARYIVFHAPTYRMGIRGTEDGNEAIASWNPLNQIEYYQEDPKIREMFEEELEEKGIENRMEEHLYEPPEEEQDVWSK